ncbi:NAD(P)/FAD-dependent oxidoreductase [Acidihalobacter ferrooxydans]|uniref:NAD/FAD-binding protein n=1 Tax=Acidihalobacter ferrooxydans TaxID=1765967 RepID=A0A1P8UF04_9GAMM|nr:FAD-dependent oxidoreductase [Acidihalobacter ferrooxydans]APZ42368.1 NAD/FAD-binding protein [Acidihalobacter ferrooxydans]
MGTSRIAVVGSGVAGLATAWMLSQRYAVTLYERDTRLGGHANTIDAGSGESCVAMDTGFMVYNERNYPLLTRLFAHFDIATRPSDMSFSVSIGQGSYEWAGDNLNTVFAQRRNLFSRRHWRLLRDIVRFNRAAYRLLHDTDADPALRLGDFLAREGLSDALANDYLLPMAAAIWSCPTATMRDFPALSLCRFFRNHGLIDLFDRPRWRTVIGGSRQYVNRLIAAAPLQLRLGEPVHRIAAHGNGWQVRTDSGGEDFDQVVLASHADETRALLQDAPAPLMDLLGAFRYQPNDTWLHSDPSLMPQRRAVWSSWNYLAHDQSDGTRDVAVTYWLNRLQGLPGAQPWFVSLNPPHAPREDRVARHMNYTHPVFDTAAMNAQRRLPDLQGMRGLWLAGAWTGYGFHEDGLASAVSIARRLGALPEWLDLEAPRAGTAPGKLVLDAG